MDYVSPSELFTQVDKAFLMPQDSALKDYIYAWLAQQNNSGKLQAVFVHHLD